MVKSIPQVDIIRECPCCSSVLAEVGSFLVKVLTRSGGVLGGG